MSLSFKDKLLGCFFVCLIEIELIYSIVLVEEKYLILTNIL